MYIKTDEQNTRALAELERLMDISDASRSPADDKLLKKLSKAIYRYETWRYGPVISADYKPKYAWERKHPEVTRKKPLYDPRDSSHVRHKLRAFGREADKMVASAAKAGR